MRLIDADRLKTEVEQKLLVGTSVIRLIDEQPTADVAPIVHGKADGCKGLKKHFGSIKKGDFVSRTALLAMFNDEMNRLEETKRHLEQQNMNVQGIVLQQAECNYLMEIIKWMQSVETGLENLVLQLESHYNIIQSGEHLSTVYGSRSPVFEKDYNTTIEIKTVIDMLKRGLNNE